MLLFLFVIVCHFEWKRICAGWHKLTTPVLENIIINRKKESSIYHLCLILVPYNSDTNIINIWNSCCINKRFSDWTYILEILINHWRSLYRYNQRYCYLLKHMVYTNVHVIKYEGFHILVIIQIMHWSLCCLSFFVLRLLINHLQAFPLVIVLSFFLCFTVSD
jgi:hypothetical protein